MTFRRKLMISLALLLVPLFASHLYFQYRNYTARERTLIAEQLQTARQLSASLELFVTRTIAVHDAVGKALTSPHWHDLAARRKYMSSVADTTPVLRQMAFTDPSGTVVMSAPRSMTDAVLSQKPYFKQITGGAHWTVANVSHITGSKSPGIVIASAVRDDNGVLIGIVVSEVDEVKLLQALHTRPTLQTTLVLIDSSGRLAYISSRPERQLTRIDWSELNFGRKRGQVDSRIVERLKVPGGQALTGALVTVPEFGWTAGAFIPREEITSPARLAATADVLIMLVVFGLTLLIGMIVANQMTEPIKLLSRSAEKLGHGDLSTRVPAPTTEELATLAQTMNEMAASIQQRDADLREAYRRERRISSTLQRTMLPQIPEKLQSLRIATSYFPAFEEAEIGGDFYDVIQLPNGQVGIVIADVSGKGLKAAVHTAMVKYMLQGFTIEDADPASVLTKLNHAVTASFSDPLEETFITLFFAILDPVSGAVSYANAGHPQPLLKRSDGETIWLNDVAGLPLGVDGSTVYQSAHVTLEPGDSLLLYTDGIIEAHSKDLWFGPEDLKLVVSSAEASPEELVELVHSSTANAVGGKIPDDVALVAVSFL